MQLNVKSGFNTIKDVIELKLVFQHEVFFYCFNTIKDVIELKLLQLLDRC